eukprot:m.458082 g.458082  ORF g.458082 m.458082 type:complete len:68 (+) comp210072_c0_seq1:28-231(+)
MSEWVSVCDQRTTNSITLLSLRSYQWECGGAVSPCPPLCNPCTLASHHTGRWSLLARVVLVIIVFKS